MPLRAAIPAILLLTLVVPVGFRYLWPGGVARPRLFIRVTLGLALLVAGSAIFWFLQPPPGAGNFAAAPDTATGNALLEARLRNRFFAAAVCAFLAQYWVCRATQFYLARRSSAIQRRR